MLVDILLLIVLFVLVIWLGVRQKNIEMDSLAEKAICADIDTYLAGARRNADIPEQQRYYVELAEHSLKVLWTIRRSPRHLLTGERLVPGHLRHWLLR